MFLRIHLLLSSRTCLTVPTDSGLRSQARPLNTIRDRCSQVCSRWAQQQIALPAPTQRHYWLMAHWVWLRHHRLPENIKVFSTAQTARCSPFCAVKKENGEGFKRREEEEGERLTHRRRKKPTGAHIMLTETYSLSQGAFSGGALGFICARRLRLYSHPGTENHIFTLI